MSHIHLSLYNNAMHKLRRFGILLVFFLVINLLSPRRGIASTPALINILSPGDESAVTSPIDLTAEIQPEGDGLVRVSLVDRQNTVLARQLIQTDQNNPSSCKFSTHLAFEITTESAPALLTLALQDEYHRPLALRSVLLTLHANGTATITEQSKNTSWLEIDQPVAHESLSGGNFRVEGRVTPLTQKPVIFELITDTGGVIGSSQLAIQESNAPIDFSIQLSYAFITTTRNVRMVVRQTIDPFGANVILDSLPIILSP